MSRSPAARPRQSDPAQPYCPENDCQREQARALTRIADVGEAMLAEFDKHKGTLETFGEIVGLWLKACRFFRKWFPKLWWLPLLLFSVVTRGGSEATDALIEAAITALQAYVAGGGA